jgi:hypothetical protein
VDLNRLSLTHVSRTAGACRFNRDAWPIFINRCPPHLMGIAQRMGLGGFETGLGALGG